MPKTSSSTDSLCSLLTLRSAINSLRVMFCGVFCCVLVPPAHIRPTQDNISNSKRSAMARFRDVEDCPFRSLKQFVCLFVWFTEVGCRQNCFDLKPHRTKLRPRLNSENTQLVFNGYGHTGLITYDSIIPMVCSNVVDTLFFWGRTNIMFNHRMLHTWWLNF